MQERESPGPRIVVVGSINLDLVVRLGRLPRPGETVTGESLHQLSGGKGANQAVAAARLGARCRMVGRVGDDVFGPVLKRNLADAGVAIDDVRITPDCSSGVAVIHVEASGENAITIVPGANGRLTPADVEACIDLIAGADALIVQLEVPIETVAAAVQVARAGGVLTVLDPAPAPRRPLPTECLHVDVISPNQSEAQGLTGLAVTGPDDAAPAARALRDLGARRVVIKLGAAGAFWLDETGQTGHVPTRPVEVVDTTAAGDAFTAALTLGLARGRPLPQAVREGCAAGSLAATRLGAQPSMPRLDELEHFLERMP